MARNHSFRRGGISPSQKRKKTWSPFLDGAGFALVGTIPAPNSTVLTDYFIFTPRPDVEESTIIRTYLEGTFTPKAITGAGTVLSGQFSVGLGIVTNEAAAAAASGGVPSPGTLGGQAWDGWFAHETFSWNLADSTGFIENRRIVIDSKAMRKLISGTSLVVAFALASPQVAATGTLGYGFGGRFLTMLP